MKNPYYGVQPLNFDNNYFQLGRGSLPEDPQNENFNFTIIYNHDYLQPRFYKIPRHRPKRITLIIWRRVFLLSVSAGGNRVSIDGAI